MLLRLGTATLQWQCRDTPLWGTPHKGAYGDMIIMGTSREKWLNCLGFGCVHVPIIFWEPMVAIASMTDGWHHTARQPDPVFSEGHWRFPQAGLT